MTERSYKAGEQFFIDGDRGAEAYLIKSGSVCLYKNKDGQEIEIATISKGNVFGEMAIISDMNRMASARAIEDTVVSALHRNKLQERLDNLENDKRLDMEYLICFCQEFLPYSEHQGARDSKCDERTYDLIKAWQNDGKTMNFNDKLLEGIFRTLIGYSARRLPPHLKS